jgi:hypothetical protein
MSQHVQHHSTLSPKDTALRACLSNNYFDFVSSGLAFLGFGAVGYSSKKSFLTLKIMIFELGLCIHQQV